jgi:hypothetical protein
MESTAELFGYKPALTCEEKKRVAAERARAVGDTMVLDLSKGVHEKNADGGRAMECWIKKRRGLKESGQI